MGNVTTVNTKPFTIVQQQKKLGKLTRAWGIFTFFNPALFCTGLLLGAFCLSASYSDVAFIITYGVSFTIPAVVAGVIIWLSVRLLNYDKRQDKKKIMNITSAVCVFGIVLAVISGLAMLLVCFAVVFSANLIIIILIPVLQIIQIILAVIVAERAIRFKKRLKLKKY